MSAFNSVITFPSAEAAEAYMSSVTPTGTDKAEHKVQIDVIQGLTLGGISLDQVAAAGHALVIDNGGCQKGRSYDFFTESQRAYGRHTFETAASIAADSVVTSRMTFKNLSGLKGRRSLTIKSDLVTTDKGVSYFIVEKMNEQDSGSLTSYDIESVMGLNTDIELYVQDLDKGVFYFLTSSGREYVLLGDTRAWDLALDMIRDNDRDPIMPRFKATLQTLSAEQARQFKREAREGSYDVAQQKLFWTVFKAIKNTIVPIIPQEAPQVTKATKTTK